MKIRETENIREIYILYLTDRDKEYYLYDVTETISDAYKIAEDFLNDKFNLSLEEVEKIFKSKTTDYVTIYNEEKLDYWSTQDSYKDLKKLQYYFRIVLTNTVKIKE